MALMIEKYSIITKTFYKKLTEIADDTASSYMPFDSEIRERMQDTFDAENIVNSCLEDYKIQLGKIGWVP